MKSKNLILFGIFVIVMCFAVVHFTKIIINKSAISSLKKLYNTYTLALQATVEELEGNIGCYFSTDKNYPNNFEDCNKFFEIFTKQLNVNKVCEKDSLLNGCLPTYQSYLTTPSCEGFSEKMMNEVNQSYVMLDNTSITIYNQPAGEAKPLFAVDTNGKLSPNKSGHDLFSFVIIRTRNGSYTFHPNLVHCLPQEPDGIHQLQDIYK